MASRIFFYLLNNQPKIHALIECDLIAFLDRWTVGDGIGEWNSNLNDVGPCPLEVLGNYHRAVRLWKSCGVINVKNVFLFLLKEPRNPVVHFRKVFIAVHRMQWVLLVHSVF